MKWDFMDDFMDDKGWRWDVGGMLDKGNKKVEEEDIGEEENEGW